MYFIYIKFYFFNKNKLKIYNKNRDWSAKRIINKLIWIDAKVNNEENKNYRKILKEEYNLNIIPCISAESGIYELKEINFESIFIITSGTIFPQFYSYLKRDYNKLKLLPFSIIFTSSSKNFFDKHKNDEIGTLYYKTFFNKGGVVDNFNDVKTFINDIYTKLYNFKTINKFEGLNTKDYSSLIVFENVSKNLSLPSFYSEIFENKKINSSEIKNFTKFFLTNFCTEKVEILLKPLILLENVPETILCKYWARVYTYETPFYSIMNKNLMKRNYKEYQIYIQLLYNGLACNSYMPKFNNTLYRGTTLEKSEIRYLKNISGTSQIIINKSFLSFTLNQKKAIEFQENESREGDEPSVEEKENYILNTSQSGIFNNSINGLDILIILDNINQIEKYNYVMSNAHLEDISFYSKEEEVLIFPFTGFEVINWEETEFIRDEKKVYGTIFYFKFSKNYSKLINEKYN